MLLEWMNIVNRILIDEIDEALILIISEENGGAGASLASHLHHFRSEQRRGNLSSPSMLRLQ